MNDSPYPFHLTYTLLLFSKVFFWSWAYIHLPFKFLFIKGSYNFITNRVHQHVCTGCCTFSWSEMGDGVGGGGKKATLLKICFTYPTMIKLGSYTLPKEDQRNILLESHWHQYFSPEFSKFCSIKKYITFWVCKDCLDTYCYNFDDISKNGCSRPC